MPDNFSLHFLLHLLFEALLQALPLLLLSLFLLFLTIDKREHSQHSSLNLRWLLLKEVIQPHLPIRLPCYDFTPVMNPTVVIAPLAVRLTTSGETHSHGVTGGVYKTRERIHRDMLIRDY